MTGGAPAPLPSLAPPRDARSGRASVLVLFALLLALAALLFARPNAGPLAALDDALFDAGSRARQDSVPAEDRVAVVGIDDATLARFPEPMSLWHAHLGRLFRALAAARPAAVAVDLNLPERSFDFVVPGLDRELAGGILELRKVAPVFLAQTVEVDGRLRRIHPLFLSVARAGSDCSALWKTDADRVIRHWSDRIGDGGESASTLVGCVSRALGLSPAPGYLDYGVGSGFDYTPIQDSIDLLDRGDGAELARRFGGKVVFVGSVLPFVDRHVQPVPLARWEPGERNVPGMLIHAQAVRSILGPGLIRPAGAPLRLLLLASALLLFLVSARPFLALGALSLWLAAAGAASFLLLGHGVRLPVAAPALLSVATAGSRALLETTTLLRERRRLRRLYAYASPKVLARILAGEIDPAPGGERRRIAVLFSDIRGFTSRSESVPPEEILTLLNRYFDEMGEAIAEQDGTLDKFIGDGIMAFFGAPDPQTDPEERAFRAAKSMLERLARFNERLVAEHLPPIAIGIGLHSGIAVVGHVGSRRQLGYTAIGDTVNLAARLESMSKKLGMPVILSGSFAAALASTDELRSLGVREVRGRSQVVVFGWEPGGAGGERIRAAGKEEAS